MTSLVLLRDIVDESNAESLFDQVSRKTGKKQIKEMIATLTAKPADPGVGSGSYTVRKARRPKAIIATAEVQQLRAQLLPAPDPTEDVAPPATPDPAPSAPPTDSPAPTLLLVPPPEKRSEIRPLGADLYDVSMRVQRRFVDLLEEARISESHSVPDGNPEAILIRALELLIERAGKKNGKIPVKSNQRTKQISQNPDSAYITSSLLREVMIRDDFSCRWPMAGGGVCASRERVEPDHILCRAKGGKTEASNLRILCHEHNAQAAREQLGAAFVEERIRNAKARRKGARREAAGANSEGEGLFTG